MTDQTELTITPADLELRQKSVDMFLSATPEAIDAPMSEWREGFDKLCCSFEVPADTTVESLVINGVPCLKVIAAGASADHVVVHFHSGGYVMGSAKGYSNFASRLSKVTGATVILPDYRLAPEHPYPAPVEDATAVYNWVLEHWDASKFVLTGDSAGGGLCMSTLLNMRDSGKPLPVAAVAICPLLDLAGEGESSANLDGSDPLIARDLIVGMGKVYIGDRDPHEHPLASPLWGQHHGLPPLLLLASASESLRDDVVRMAESVRKAGGDVTVSMPDGLIHVWTLFPFLREAEQSMAGIGAFIRKHMGLA